MPTGHGTFFEENNDSYEGDWLDGKKHGKGRAVYGGRASDQFGADVYEGGFEDDMNDQFGANVYEGGFEDDMKHGKGTMMYGSGDVYEGCWARDQKHGTGSYFYITKGKRFDGVWEEGMVRTGTYSEIHTPPPGTAGSLPPVELANPDAVIANAAAEVTASLG
eukprot:gene11785-14917_t